MNKVMKDTSNKVTARLTKPISYKKDGQPVFVPTGTQIFVDTDLSVCLVGDDHVYIEEDEYAIANN